MFTPDQERAASELIRVCRPGGKIGLANWTPEGSSASCSRRSASICRRLPAPGRRRSGAREARIAELFGPHASSIQAVPRSFTFRYRSPEHWLDVFRTYYGPLLKAFAALDAAGQSALEHDIMAIIDRLNRSGDGTMIVPSEYLEVVITRS